MGKTKTLVKTSQNLPESASPHFRALVDYRLVDTMVVKRDYKIVVKPSETFPQMTVIVPDHWPHIKLAPLYDAHIGSLDCADDKLQRDIAWMAADPYLLTWNGGDMWDNAITRSVAKPQTNSLTPNQQFDRAKMILDPIKEKMLFAIPGNHEQRTSREADIDVARIFNNVMDIPYSLDYMFCSIKWRGNCFRIMAHHGSGAAQSPGGQRNAARKDMPWARADLYWTGHLHQPITDVVYQTDWDQKTGEIFERDAMVIISPSYLYYFGGYAATKRLAPGVRGLTVATLQEDGRIDVEMHANGKRL